MKRDIVNSAHKLLLNKMQILSPFGMTNLQYIVISRQIQTLIIIKYDQLRFYGRILGHGDNKLILLAAVLFIHSHNFT